MASECPKYVSFLQAPELYIKNALNFSGRSTRSEYWWMQLWIFLIYFTVSFSIIFAGLGKNTLDRVTFIMNLIIAVPGLALTFRRLHDTGRSGWHILLCWIPIYILVIACIDSVPENEWGPSAYELQHQSEGAAQNVDGEVVDLDSPDDSGNEFPESHRLSSGERSPYRDNYSRYQDSRRYGDDE